MKLLGKFRPLATELVVVFLLLRTTRGIVPLTMAIIAMALSHWYFLLALIYNIYISKIIHKIYRGTPSYKRYNRGEMKKTYFGGFMVAFGTMRVSIASMSALVA